MVESLFIKSLSQNALGMLLALFILGGLYKLVNKFGVRFIEAQDKQAEALSQQAQSLAALTTALRDSTARDNTEHREMLVLLRFIAQQQKDFDEVKIEHNRRKEQTHPHCPHGTP